MTGKVLLEELYGCALVWRTCQTMTLHSSCFHALVNSVHVGPQCSAANMKFERTGNFVHQFCVLTSIRRERKEEALKTRKYVCVIQHFVLTAFYCLSVSFKVIQFPKDTVLSNVRISLFML